ncbi:MAG TPA: ABC transporter permease subunit [Candidatus Limnocylindria bacterium]|nr:ABC transporter permease subunit [Candidatus Limnocylindria bacterium]
MTASAASRPRPASGVSEFASSVATILSKELRGRFRGRRAFVVLTIYVAVLALIAYGAYVVEAPSARDAANGGTLAPDGVSTVNLVNASSSIGQAIFSMLSVFQLLLVAFIAPALTAGAISLEREKQTLDLLVTTPMRPGAIVVGKLVAALAFVLLMIVAGIPVSALVLMYGGANQADIVRQQVVLVTAAVGFGVIGIFFSALARRTQAATVLAYSAMLVLAIGTILAWRLGTEILTNDASNRFGQVMRAPEEILWLNPAVAMIEVVANTEFTYGDFTETMQSIRGDAYVPPALAPPAGASGGAVADCPPNARCVPPLDTTGVAAATQTPTVGSEHFLWRFVVSMSALSLVLALAAMRLVVPAGLRWRPARRRTGPAVADAGEPAVVEPEP